MSAVDASLAGLEPADTPPSLTNKPFNSLAEIVANTNEQIEIHFPYAGQYRRQEKGDSGMSFRRHKQKDDGPPLITDFKKGIKRSVKYHLQKSSVYNRKKRNTEYRIKRDSKNTTHYVGYQNQKEQENQSAQMLENEVVSLLNQNKRQSCEKT